MSAFHSAQKARPGQAFAGVGIEGKDTIIPFQISVADGAANAEVLMDIIADAHETQGGTNPRPIREVRLHAAGGAVQVRLREATSGFEIPFAATSGVAASQPPLVLHFGPGGVPEDILISNTSGGALVVTILALC